MFNSMCFCSWLQTLLERIGFSVCLNTAVSMRIKRHGEHLTEAVYACLLHVCEKSKRARIVTVAQTSELALK